MRKRSKSSLKVPENEAMEIDATWVLFALIAPKLIQTKEDKKDGYTVTYPWNNKSAFFTSPITPDQIRKLFKEEQARYVENLLPIIKQDITILKQKHIRLINRLNKQKIEHVVVPIQDEKTIQEWLQVKCSSYSFDCEVAGATLPITSGEEKKRKFLRTIQIARTGIFKKCQVLLIDFGLNYNLPSLTSPSLKEFIENHPKSAFDIRFDLAILETYGVKLNHVIDLQEEFAKQLKLNGRLINLNNFATLVDVNRKIERKKVNHKVCWNQEKLDPESVEYAIQDAVLIGRLGILYNKIF